MKNVYRGHKTRLHLNDCRTFSANSWYLFDMNNGFEMTPIKKASGFKSGDRADQGYGPFYSNYWLENLPIN